MRARLDLKRQLRTRTLGPWYVLVPVNKWRPLRSGARMKTEMSVPGAFKHVLVD